jgi:hypothetical protein
VRVARGAAVERGDLPASAAVHRGARNAPPTVDDAHAVMIGLRLILNYTINFECCDPRARAAMHRLRAQRLTTPTMPQVLKQTETRLEMDY